MAQTGTLAQLGRFESRNVTFIDPSGGWPIVWAKAQGMWVWDEQGRRYLDLTGAFGVAAAGHANRAVVKAGNRQMRTLLHAMGDVHPHALKAQLAEKLVGITYGRWMSTESASSADGQGRVVFGTSGFEAVEIALKTAVLATGRPGVIVFEGAYHGLGYGALSGTHRPHFRSHFRAQLREFGYFIPFPQCLGCDCCQGECAALDSMEGSLNTVWKAQQIGAVLVEPIQARGGIRIPPSEFLLRLRRWCTEKGALLILDEIYTGFGRTGRWFAAEHTGVVPDLICLGKALTGGFPLSACVGRSQVMDAWPQTRGEGIHTSTFLGHPVGCAMALAQIDELTRLRLIEHSETLGRRLAQYWSEFPRELGGLRLFPRHQGLMIGVEVRDEQLRPAAQVAWKAIKRLLERGYLLLPEGEHGEVISLTPPLVVSWRQLRATLEEMIAVLAELAPHSHPSREFVPGSISA